ncbi:MAG: hypothetical protein PHS46_08550 [Candidatus Omnitrophica bacterium]|nr:hypothetical protein [Candidatus Omnitrophota bacterium]
MEEIRKAVLFRIGGSISPNQDTVRAIDLAINLTAKQIFEEVASKTKDANCDCPASGELGCICDLYEVMVAIDKMRVKYGV